MFLETGSSLSFWPPEMCQDKLTPQPGLRSRFNFPVTRLLDSSFPHKPGVSHSLALLTGCSQTWPLTPPTRWGRSLWGRSQGGHLVAHTALWASPAVSGAQIPWL